MARVLPLTRELAARLRVQAAVALNGDGTCSLRTMSTSCFASEHCARGYSAMQIDMLCASPHAFVAVCGTCPRGTPLAEEAFVGCVSAAPACGGMVAQLFPHVTLAPGALVLSNLCVADAYRGHGLGRKLVQAVLDVGAPETYLLIARTGVGHANPDVAAAFADRVPRLQETYRKLRFHQVCECSTAALLRYHP